MLFCESILRFSGPSVASVILIGDVLKRLMELPDNSVDCIVTSPPYWGLRDYGVEGQMGLEPTLGEHIEALVLVFREIRRVLKPTGTCWVNYGDCYAADRNGRSAADVKAHGRDDRTFRDKPFSTIGPVFAPNAERRDRRGGLCKQQSNEGSNIRGRVLSGGYLKPKDLCLMPARLAIALQDDGWWVRSEIIWGKTNPMPESCRDRPHNAHEKIWLLTKEPIYSYDNEAVRQGRTNDEDAVGFRGGSYTKNTTGKRERTGNKKVRGHRKEHTGFATRWDQMTKEEQQAKGRNLRNYEPASMEVWQMATRPFPKAHFATFPPELAERCILAGSPRGGIVLDPFGGAGTTALVALRHGRSAISIELNPDYAQLAHNRIREDWMGGDELANTQTAPAESAGPLFD
ncbi:DNA-methyltransferase [Pseudovibrio ascidiaceicola]|uniref:DNA-methyltransferase n=1 Tax=Pseudovibrio ascidiaceicola TaxID=285279 RepID=UPI003D361E3F